MAKRDVNVVDFAIPAISSVRSATIRGKVTQNRFSEGANWKIKKGQSLNSLNYGHHNACTCQIATNASGFWSRFTERNLEEKRLNT